MVGVMLEYLRDSVGRWCLRQRTREDDRFSLFLAMDAQHSIERETIQKQFREDIEREREGQREMIRETLEVMGNLVNSVKSSNDLLANYLGLFTSAGKPQIRTMSEADLAVREAETIRDTPVTRRKEILPPDPFKWMGDRPDLFDGKSDELADIKDSLAL